MNVKLSLLFITLCCLISACGNKSEQEIEELTSTGVVLVQNKSYYEVVLSNGESVYFSSFDDDGSLNDFTVDQDSIKMAIGYGTGFFISDQGELVTNAHVVSNITSDKDVNKSISNIINSLKEVAKAAYDEMLDKYETAQIACDYANYNPEVSYSDYYQIKEIRDALGEEVQKYAQIYNELDEIRAGDSEIKYHNVVSIGYNNTFVTADKDLISCVITKTDQEHDLAILQLKDKKTPADKYIFTIPEKDPLDTYSLMDNIEKKIKDDKNSKLYMSSFNLGPTLAITKEGIKSQFTQGTISQKTNDRVMYSIPALPGSSGSPVVNQKGELVAINYAGLNGTQNFNYGIRVIHLKNLLSK